MGEIDYGPSGAGGAAEDGENEKPGEEEDEYVGGPNTRVRKPLRVPVHIRRRHRLHVQVRHRFSLTSINRLIIYSKLNSIGFSERKKKKNINKNCNFLN